MFKLSPDKEINHQKIRIVRENGSSFSALVLSPKEGFHNAPGILWLHVGPWTTVSGATVFVPETQKRTSNKGTTETRTVGNFKGGYCRKYFYQYG